MARKRSLPTGLFANPDFFELTTNTIRLIFIGLILDADDEGRGSAHPRLLARKLDQQPEEIDQALAELVACHLIQWYEVDGRQYYWICQWQSYQTLSKPTASGFPVPPGPLAQEQETSPVESLSQQADAPGQGKRPRHTSPVIAASPPDKPPIGPRAAQVAGVLHLPESEELHQIMREFHAFPTLSILGEAIEARAWIDDPGRNTRKAYMTLAFFRRWLRRSQQGLATKGGVPHAEPGGRARRTRPSRNLISTKPMSRRLWRDTASPPHFRRPANGTL